MLRTDGCTGAFGPRAGILRRSGAWSIGTSSRAGDSDLETLAFLLIIIDLGFLDDLQPPVASLFSFRFSFRKIHNDSTVPKQHKKQHKCGTSCFLKPCTRFTTVLFPLLSTHAVVLSVVWGPWPCSPCFGTRFHNKILILARVSHTHTHTRYTHTHTRVLSDRTAKICVMSWISLHVPVKLLLFAGTAFPSLTTN
jgi:hypothetical protein